MRLQTRGMRTRARAATLAAAGLALAVALPGMLAPSATAADPKLTLSKSGFGANATDVRVTVTGKRYLVPPHVEGDEVFGGVYVFFGWVKPGGKWGPSHRNSNNNRGNYGVTYSYPGEQGDAGLRDGGDGAIRFVAFTEGGASGDATPYHMDAKGNWSAQVTVPGPTYTYRDIAGKKHTVDCRAVTCGIYTIGAHGKPSATNEVFTPVSFAAAAPTATPKPTKTAKPTKSAEPTKTAKPSKSPSPTTSTSPSPTVAAVSPSPSAPVASAPAPPTSEPPSSTPVAAEPLASQSDASTPAGLWVGLGVLAILVGGGLTWWLRRRPTA